MGTFLFYFIDTFCISQSSFLLLLSLIFMDISDVVVVFLWNIKYFSRNTIPYTWVYVLLKNVETFFFLNYLYCPLSYAYVQQSFGSKNDLGVFHLVSGADWKKYLKEQKTVWIKLPLSFVFRLWMSVWYLQTFRSIYLFIQIRRLIGFSVRFCCSTQIGN